MDGYRIRSYRTGDYADIINLIVQSERLTNENYISPNDLKESIVGRKDCLRKTSPMNKDSPLGAYLDACKGLQVQNLAAGLYFWRDLNGISEHFIVSAGIRVSELKMDMNDPQIISQIDLSALEQGGCFFHS